jgi:hypothetical protein
MISLTRRVRDGALEKEIWYGWYIAQYADHVLHAKHGDRHYDAFLLYGHPREPLVIWRARSSKQNMRLQLSLTLEHKAGRRLTVPAQNRAYLGSLFFLKASRAPPG